MAPRLELFGAGFATAIVNLAMFGLLLCITVFVRPFRKFRIVGGLWRSDWHEFFRVLRIGVPIGGTTIMEVGMVACSILMIGLIGTTELAAHSIALQIVFLAFTVPLGLGHAATVRVGLHYGAGRKADVPRAGLVAILLGLAFMSITAMLFWLVPEFLVGLFLGPDVQGRNVVIAMGTGFLAVAAIFQLVDGAQGVGVACLRGLSDTKIPMYFAAFGFWGVGLTACYILAFPVGLGGIGVWIGLTLGFAAAAVLMVSWFYILTRPGRL